MRPIYLDYNATAPLDPQVLQVYANELKEDVGNASSIHFYGQECRRKLEKSRQTIARFFNVKPREIIFTSGGTEGAALLLQGILQQNPNGHVISSKTEHACVYQTLQEYGRRGCSLTFLPVSMEGSINLEDLEKAIHSNTRLITFMAVNNETGVMNDIKAIAEIAQKANIPFIVDAVAWLGKERIEIPSGVSALFFAGHKIHGPKGIGFCLLKQNLKLAPFMIGGNHEYQRRGGTENLPAISALAEAVSLLERDQEEFILHIRKMRDLFEQGILSRLSDVAVNGAGSRRVSNTSNLAFLGVDAETLLVHLDLVKVFASHGSACSSGGLEPSRVLLEMGMPLSRVRSSIRFSFGRTTTEEEVAEAVERIVPLVSQLRQV